MAARLRRHRRRPITLRLVGPLERPWRAPNLRRHLQFFVGAFAGIIAVGALLLSLPFVAADGEATPPVDALFTAVSAACVTGLVTVDTATHWNLAGKVVILTLMQCGGLSFTVGASVVLQMLRRGNSLRDALLLRDGEPALTIGEVVDLARRILRFTVIVEAIGAVILAVRFRLDGMSIPDAAGSGVFYAVSAFCNASFDLTGGFRSLIPYQTDPVVLLTIAGLIQAGALSYLVFSEVLARRNWTRLSLDAKLVLIGHGAPAGLWVGDDAAPGVGPGARRPAGLGAPARGVLPERRRPQRRVHGRRSGPGGRGDALPLRGDHAGRRGAGWHGRRHPPDYPDGRPRRHRRHPARRSRAPVLPPPHPDRRRLSRPDRHRPLHDRPLRRYAPAGAERRSLRRAGRPLRRPPVRGDERPGDRRSLDRDHARISPRSANSSSA